MLNRAQLWNVSACPSIHCICDTVELPRNCSVIRGALQNAAVYLQSLTPFFQRNRLALRTLSVRAGLFLKQAVSRWAQWEIFSIPWISGRCSGFHADTSMHHTLPGSNSVPWNTIPHISSTAVGTPCVFLACCEGRPPPAPRLSLLMPQQLRLCLFLSERESSCKLDFSNRLNRLLSFHQSDRLASELRRVWLIPWWLRGLTPSLQQVNGELAV